DIYYIMYTAYSRFGARLALAKTTDFKTFERIGLVSEPENKDGCLFPRKIKGRYARLDRPFGGGTGNIWVSYSDDLVNWGNSEVVMTTRPGYWDSDRIGASPPPIETEHGWLAIYHGVKNTAAGPLYRMGAVLLDLENPAKVICRSSVPILTPREYYERVGDVGNVVFSCGVVLEDDGRLKIYYGAADTCICLGFAHVDELIERCRYGGDGDEEE
ncbi:MAG: glycoside hydrolase family 130 protein, partial [Armatimonadota bacterium]